MILQLSSGQPVKPGGVLIQQAAGLEMQLTAEQFAYRAFHSAQIRIIWFTLASPIVAFWAGNSASLFADDALAI